MIDMETAAEPESHRSARAFHEEAAACEEEFPPPPPSINLWQIGAGTLVLACGVLLPILSIAVAIGYSFEGIWRLILLHPIETLTEAFLVLCVPAANYAAWHSLCHSDGRHPIRLGIFNGIAIAVPAITLSISIACFALNYPIFDSATKEPHSLSLSLMGCASCITLLCSLYLTHALRKAKQTRDARIRTIVYSLMGVCLTLFSLVAAECRSTYIRIAQTMSLSDDDKERANGLAMLRGAGPEKELKMVCADAHAAGLAGLFLPLDADAQKRLYFAATGKPYRDRQSTNMSLMSNDYLHNHVVGAPVEGLSLHRSAILGNVHPETLTSTLNWTFVFKNKTYVNQEARAELALPEGAVISDLTLWINGKPRSGAFSATEQAAGAYNWIVVQHRDPALITDLGRGRYLLQASPVPGQGEMKVQVSITEPLKLDGENNASFGMPRFIDSNFSLKGQHSIKLRSTEDMLSGVGNVKSIETMDHAKLLSQELSEENISNSTFSVKLGHAVNFHSMAVRDPFTGGVLLEELKTRSANAPRHLVVVVDSSQAMKAHIDEVVNALTEIPGQIDTSIILAGDNESAKTMSRAEGIQRLKNNEYGGGQDNLFALTKAAERAGESKGGAVLWIHGPQPGYNNEMYIVAPYAATPSFFEVALDDCLTDTNEFFKNHKEIGPFAAVPRSGPLKEDLHSFLSKWKPGAMETYMEMSTTNSPVATINNSDAEREVSILSAAHSVQHLLDSGKTSEGAALGVNYHIVTPVSGAVVLENANDYRRFGMNVPAGTPEQSQNQVNRAAPVLQGATNGGIAPQGDATVLTGINTAGTVRVNNLANLEALLNIFANGGEILGLILGVFNVVMGLVGKSMMFPFRVSAQGRIACGICMAIIALAIPGSLNWMVASARDANLFD